MILELEKLFKKLSKKVLTFLWKCCKISKSGLNDSKKIK